MKSLATARTALPSRVYISKFNQFPGYDRLTLLEHLSENRKIYYHGQTAKKIQCYLVILNKKLFKNQKEMYNWRSTTQLPIVKAYFFDILEQNDNEIKVNIFYQYCPQRLSDFCEIPLSQILYLMKQSLIGFQRLFSKIKGFEINSNMIAINDSKKCKVWINEDFTKNQPKKMSIDETQYLQRIIDIYSAFVLRTNLSRQFFQGFSNIKKFVKAFNYIDTFAHKNRILIPSRFALEQRTGGQNSFCYQPQFFNIQQPKKYICFNQKRSWNKSQKISVKKTNSNLQGMFLEFSHKTTKDYSMKNSNETTQANSIKEYISSNSKQISSGYDDFQGQMEERDLNNPQIGQINRKPELMFRSQINQLNGTNIKENQRKFRSGYKRQAQHMKISNELEQIKEQKNINVNKKQHWNQSKQITLLQESYQDQQQVQQLQIFRKNGWEPKINNLITDGKEIKASVTIGKDVPSVKKLRNLQLLNRFGRHIGNSRLVHDFQ